MLRNKPTFANPKSASLTDPLASTNILAHFISLENRKRSFKRRYTSKLRTIIKKFNLSFSSSTKQNDITYQKDKGAEASIK